MDDRGTAPVVGKALEIAIVLLYIGIVSGGLYGGVIPETRTTADQAIAERALTRSVEQIRDSIPPSGTGHVETSIALPQTIAGESYHVVPGDGYLVLRHPDPNLNAEASLLLPDSVTTVTGRWDSQTANVLLVNITSDGVIVRLENQ